MGYELFLFVRLWHRYNNNCWFCKRPTTMMDNSSSSKKMKETTEQQQQRKKKRQHHGSSITTPVGAKVNKSIPPQPGDPNYKTPTQLRNARKRRKVQLDKLQKKQRTAALPLSVSTSTIPSTIHNDPSLKYLSNPKAAPVVRNWMKFFHDIHNTNTNNSSRSTRNIDLVIDDDGGGSGYHNVTNHYETINNTSSSSSYFPIILGPKIGWRTICRLAIQKRTRKNSKSKKYKQRTTIGLFVPGSHDVISVQDCPVHHPSINTLVKVLEEECNNLNVPVFDNDDDDTTNTNTADGTDGSDGNKSHNDKDDTGDPTATSCSSSNNKFGLRYVSVAVERSTQKQQLVLVWKEEREENRLLDVLIQRLIKISNKATNEKQQQQKERANSSNNNKTTMIQVHSIWVHYNNSWKHSNGIFDRNGRWEPKYVYNNDDHNDHNDNNNDCNVNDNPLYGSIQEYMVPIQKKNNNSNNYNNNKQTLTTLSSKNNLLRVPLFFPPQVFRQANLDGFSKIIMKIREYLYEQILLRSACSGGNSSVVKDERQHSVSNTTIIKNNNNNSHDDNNCKRKRRRGRKGRQDGNNDSKMLVSSSSTCNTNGSSSSTNVPVTGTLGHLLELYGGVGTIGLNLIDLFDSIESSDENPFNEKCFHASADRIVTTTIVPSPLIAAALLPLPKSKRERITYITKAASDVVVDQYSSLQKARVVIVDPPRKGLDGPVIEALCRDYNNYNNSTENRQQQQTLIYVSCGFDAFRRDYKALVETSGKWSLDRAEGTSFI